MFGFKVICWALLFIFKLRFPPGVSIAKHGIWNLESWNLGILESWNLGILESYHITAKYVIIKMILFSTYATYCSACDNLIFGELAEADLGNILSVYTIRCRM